MAKDGSNARKQAARELAAAEQIPYTEALRRIDQRAAGTLTADEQNIAATGAGRVTRIRVTPPVAALTTDVVLNGHTGTVRCVAFHPDGRTFASAGDVTVRLWDLATRQTTSVLAGETEVLSAALSPDGRTLAVAYAGETVTLWAMATGQITDLTGSGGQVRSVAFSPDSRTLASGMGHGRDHPAAGPGNRLARVWDDGDAAAERDDLRAGWLVRCPGLWVGLLEQSSGRPPPGWPVRRLAAAGFRC